MATKSKKQKVNIMGKKYKVDEAVSDTLKAMSEALRSHEVALLTWVHKDYASDSKFEKEEINSFRESLNNYCLQIPEAENILKRMNELDEQIDKENKEKETKTKKEQNKEEKE